MTDQSVDIRSLDGEPGEDVDSQRIMNYTQRVRQAMVQTLIEPGLPETKEDRQVLLQTLRDMDTTAVQRTKLDIDRESLQHDRRVQEIVERFREMAPQGLRSSEPLREKPPEFDTERIEQEQVAFYETEQGLSNEDKESFMQRMEQE